MSLIPPRPYLFLILLLSLTVSAMVWRCYPTPAPLNGDNAMLIGAGRSLVESGSLEFNFRPQTRFPPLVSLFVAAAKGNPSEYEIRSLAIGSLLIGTIFYFLALSQIFDGSVALISLALFVTSAFTTSLVKGGISSDLPYFLLSSLALWILTVAANRKTSVLPLAGFVIALALLTRSIGLSLLVVSVLLVAGKICPSRYWAKLQQQRLSTLLYASLIPLLTQLYWSKWKRDHIVELWPGEFMQSYDRQFWLLNPHRPLLGEATYLDLFIRLVTNFVIQITHFAEILFQGVWLQPIPTSPIIIFLVVTIALGIFRAWQAGAYPICLYIITYFVLICFWPFDEFQRFLFPIVPALIAFAWVGIGDFIKFVISSPRRALIQLTALSAVSAVLTLGFILSNSIQVGMQIRVTLLFWLMFAGGAIILWWNHSRIENFKNFDALLLKGKKAAFLMVILLTAFNLIREYRRPQMDDQNSVVSFSIKASEVISKLSLPSDVIMAGSAGPEPIIHLLTGRKVIPFPVTATGDELAKLVLSQKINWILVMEEGEYPYFSPPEVERVKYLEGRSDLSLLPTVQLKGFAIYRVNVS